MTPKKQSPLQRLREQIKDGRELQTYSREEIGQLINSLYEFEQQLLSDAFDAGVNSCYSLEHADKETFLNQYKPEP